MSYLSKYAKICFSEVNIIILFTEWNHIQVKILNINIIIEHTPSIIT